MCYLFSMKTLIILLLLFVMCPVRAADVVHERQIAVTIDDLPFVGVGGKTANVMPIKTLTARLLEKLNRHKVPAVGFVNAGKIYYQGQQNRDVASLLTMWLEAGFELGNHTYGHADYHRVEWPEFKEDVIRGETFIKDLIQQKGKTLRYFRHPFLHTGNSPEKKKVLAEFLARRGYTVAPVTVDNSEWIFAHAYHKVVKAGNKKEMKRIVDAYILYMKQKQLYYEKQSKRLFGRPIKHILLLHANELNADHFETLVEMYRQLGYRFISLEEALKDPAYGSEDTYTGRSGISWIDRWALAKGKKGEFFKGEPETPDFVKKLAGIQYE
jgi:peptidoglycan/xylan/chitin deacetylase (PgdA/CDA1 family)